MSALATTGYTLRRAAALLGRRPWRFVSGIVAAAVAIALLLIVVALAIGLAPQATKLVSGPQINVFATVGLSARDADALQSRLSALPGAPAVTLIPRDKALAELSRRAGAPAAEPRSNPLPDVLVAQYPVSIDPLLVEQAAATIREWPGVDQVQAELAWHRRLHTLASAAGAAAAVVGAAAAFLSLIALLVAAAAQASPHRHEAAILRIAGASTAFIVRPYACAAALTLALGALLALALLAVLAQAAQPLFMAAAEALAPRFESTIGPSLPAWLPAAVVAVAAAAGWVVGGFAAWRSVHAVRDPLR